MISLERYRVLFSGSGIRRLFLASLVGRLPIGMSGLAILLLVQSESNSFAAGGMATGCYVAGLACIAPLLGRVIDRNGPRMMLLACAFLFPASMAALVAAVAAKSATSLVLACAIAAGATFPPVTVCMRTYLRQRIADDAVLATAYSADSILIELMFIAGPMLVAFFVAYANAASAVWFAAGCGFVGALLFLASLRDWRIERRRERTLLGPLAQRNFLLLIAIVLCYALAFGLTELAVAAFAAEAKRPALAGVFLGLMSAGSAFGGLAYGSRSWHGPLLRQFSLTLAVMGAGLLVLAGPWSVVTFGLLSVLAGVVMAPALIIQSMLVAKTAKPEHVTEAFTWSTSGLLAGIGIGMAAGGALVEWARSPVALCVAGAAALLAAAAAAVLARR
jgi:predicted MFS family arabinose efflux permease